MPLIFDDIALGTTAKAAEIAKAFGEISGEAFSKEFDVQSFCSDYRDVAFPSESSYVEVSEGKINHSDTLSDIKNEFSPDKFNDGSIENTIPEEKSQIEIVERTSTFEDQTIDNFELETKRPEIEDNMIRGQEHDGGILRYNMEQAMEKKSDTDISNAHHIVGRDTPQAAKKLKEFEIDRNDPANGIFLPNSSESPLKGAVHGQGRHSVDYSNEVEQLFAGATTREEALEVLQAIKEDLYSGDLYVHKDIPANK